MANGNSAPDTILGSRKFGLMLHWVRIMLPLALGGIAWYLGQIVAPLDSRIAELEGIKETVLVHVAQSDLLIQQFNEKDIMNALLIEGLRKDLNDLREAMNERTRDRYTSEDASRNQEFIDRRFAEIERKIAELE